MHTHARPELLILARRLRRARKVAPVICPISNPAPDGAIKYHVPPHLRGVLMFVVKERSELNERRDVDSYFSVAQFVDTVYEKIVLAGIRREFGLPATMIIEMHEHWICSVTTLETLREEYAKRPKKPSEESGEGSGLSYAYLKEKKEVAHLHMLTKKDLRDIISPPWYGG